MSIGHSKSDSTQIGNPMYQLNAAAFDDRLAKKSCRHPVACVT